ncbi:MAG: tetraacyldisaccharide 4'-kinase [Zoogloeaceae bacterium]|jgi:tetraacyldisaccharide 4'-kinase|nr:tetraacyldisaccharide 4'-kinase [Zoogloeaceae bacterium]
MGAWLQKFWYTPAWPLAARFARVWLLPFTGAFIALAALRRLAYRRGWLPSYALPTPVVVIGNLTVGGTGKTPLTLALVEMLRAAGWRPGIVSRGYGGSAATPLAVTPETAPSRAGDEPVLLARRAGCPLWVGRDRVATARALLAAAPEVNLILCDDGLQHYRLRRDVELVVFDTRGIGNGWRLPTGPLREPLARLRGVTALVLNGETPASLPVFSRIRAAAPGVPVLTMQLAVDHFYRLDAPRVCATATELQQRLRGRTVCAVAGIGHPERFFATLSALGFVFVPRAFPDHHAYRAEELRAAPDEVLLMTEKDGVKCASLENLPEIWVLPVSARLDPERLEKILLEKLNGRKTL